MFYGVTPFIGNIYEVAGSSVTKNYGVYPEQRRRAGTQLIAVRKDGALSYLLSDHLGSISLTVDSSRTVTASQRFTPWGEVRAPSGTMQTSYSYTGQFSNVSDFGLLFYNARWYDPYLNQFTQPDSIIPQQYDPQSWNRYEYAEDNPVRYNDPSGHVTCSDVLYWEGECQTLDTGLAAYGVTTKQLTIDQKWDVFVGASVVGSKFASIIGNSITPMVAFNKVEGHVSVIGGAQMDGCKTVDHAITCGTTYDYFLQTIIHEFGHVFDNQFNAFGDKGHFASDYTQQGWDQTFGGYQCDTYPCVQHPTPDAEDGGRGRDEDFADMFLNWAVNGNSSAFAQNGFTADAMGNARRDYMNYSNGNTDFPTGMPLWIQLILMGE